MKAWLKGGLWGGIIGLLSTIGILLDTGLASKLPLAIQYLLYPLEIIAAPSQIPMFIIEGIIGMLTGKSWEQQSSSEMILAGIILSLIYFLIGSLIGWIVGKIRARKTENS